jgi:hypothetical protein
MGKERGRGRFKSGGTRGFEVNEVEIGRKRLTIRRGRMHLKCEPCPVDDAKRSAEKDKRRSMKVKQTILENSRPVSIANLIVKTSEQFTWKRSCAKSLPVQLQCNHDDVKAARIRQLRSGFERLQLRPEVSSGS